MTCLIGCANVWRHLWIILRNGEKWWSHWRQRRWWGQKGLYEIVQTRTSIRYCWSIWVTCIYIRAYWVFYTLFCHIYRCNSISLVLSSLLSSLYSCSLCPPSSSFSSILHLALLEFCPSSHPSSPLLRVCPQEQLRSIWRLWRCWTKHTTYLFLWHPKHQLWAHVCVKWKEYLLHAISCWIHQ